MSYLLDADIVNYLIIWVERHRLGRLIQDADLLIAISARKTGAVLVTNNTRHFVGLGLVLENRASVDSA